MLKAFQNFIKEQNLFQPNQRILLAVSGGVDSVVLTHLFKQANLNFAIAHCNFSLRNIDSDQDQLFVEKLAIKYEVPFFTIKFNTLAEAKKRKISVQMVARELRYHWFENLLTRENYNLIATAHHANDLLETMLINLSRGTGLAGFHGILPSSNSVIRPMIFATKQEIEHYAVKNQLEWTEDASNKEDKYIRNLIRHKVVPVLKEINPNLERTTFQTSKKIKHIEDAFHFGLQKERHSFETKISDGIQLDIPKLSALPFAYLATVLEEFGFNISQAEKISSSLNRKNKSGKSYNSEKFSLFVDRNTLTIKPNYKPNQETKEIQITESNFEVNNQIFQTKIIVNQNHTISKAKNIAEFDIDKLVFPLTVKTWSEGDSFHPLGMKGRKKISDLLVDNKIPLHQKPSILVVISGSEIIWVVGMRTSDPFKITDQTKRIFKIELLT